MFDFEVVVKNVEGILVGAENMVLISSDSHRTFKGVNNRMKLLSEIGAVLISDTLDKIKRLGIVVKQMNAIPGKLNMRVWDFVKHTHWLGLVFFFCLAANLFK